MLILFKKIYAQFDIVICIQFIEYKTNNKESRTKIQCFPKISHLQNC